MFIALRLGLAAARHHRLRTLAISLALALVLLFPLALKGLAVSYQEATYARGLATPLVLGAPGNRFDLVLAALYFRPQALPTVSLGALERVADPALGELIPLHLGHRAQGAPVVGTSLGYFGRRGLKVAAGGWPLVLGDAVVGASVAKRLSLKPGDRLLSEPQGLYDLAQGYSLALRVRGVLAEAGGPDDEAVFVDYRTGWVLDGIGHGHDAPPPIPGVAGPAIADPALPTDRAIEDLSRFHFHGDLQSFPLSGALFFPKDAKAKALLRGRLDRASAVSAVSPAEVQDELWRLVLGLEPFFALQFGLALAAAALLSLVVAWLSRQLRAEERATLIALGASRLTLLGASLTEALACVLLSALFSTALSLLVYALAPSLGQWLAP